MSVKIKSWVSIFVLIGMGILFNDKANSSPKDSSATSPFPILIFDTDKYPDKSSFPRNFRTGNSWFKHPKIADDNLPSRKGLENLNMSGSAQFSVIELKNMMGLLATKFNTNTIYIIDLRQESHGFLDNTPVSWYGPHNDENSDKSGKDIKQIEDNLLKTLREQDSTTVYLKDKTKNTEEGAIVNNEGKFTPRTIGYQSAMDENEIANRNKAQYLRIYVEDHYPPKPEQVDAFLNFVKKSPKNHWLHFHCQAGGGRTTTFMVMLDIIRNGQQVSLDDIVKRQFLMGGDNLGGMNFIKQFYEYVNDKAGYTKQNWSLWLKQKENTSIG